MTIHRMGEALGGPPMRQSSSRQHAALRMAVFVCAPGLKKGTSSFAGAYRETGIADIYYETGTKFRTGRDSILRDEETPSASRPKEMHFYQTHQQCKKLVL
jgi:hypothetical protein